MRLTFFFFQAEDGIRDVAVTGVQTCALRSPMNYITHSAPFDRGKLWLGSAFVAIPGEEQSGTFTAIDVNTGKIAWQNKLPDPLIGGGPAPAGGGGVSRRGGPRAPFPRAPAAR